MISFPSFGRDALLLETLSIVAKCQDPTTFWSDTMARLKWILDFTRVDVALQNPDGETYDLETIFEFRPDVPRTAQTGILLDKGIFGQMMRSGEACHCFRPRLQPFAKEFIVDESLEGGAMASVLSVGLEAGGKVLGVLTFGSDSEAGFCHQEREIATRFATHAAIAVQNWQHLRKLKEDAVSLDLAAEKLRDSHSELESLVAQRTGSLRKLSQVLLRTQDQERRRVARDLHDSTGQTLVALKLQIAAMQTRFELGRAAFEALSEVAATAEQALQEIRTTSYLLHPPLLDEVGLDSATRWYVEGFSKRSGIQVRLDQASGFERAPGDIEMVLFRILQESLVNVHRHSGASLVDIGLERSSKTIVMSVHDNGRGMAPELLQRLQTTHANGGVGLAGMWERINELGGQMQIESNSFGTTLRVSIPLAGVQAEKRPRRKLGLEVLAPREAGVELPSPGSAA